MKLWSEGQTGASFAKLELRAQIFSSAKDATFCFDAFVLCQNKYAILLEGIRNGLIGIEIEID